MNTRKFTYVTTLILGTFLLVLGTVLLFYINNVNPENKSAPLTDILKGLNAPSKKESMNFLVLIGDKSSENTDVMLAVNYNPELNKISLLTIPRDTKVKIKNNFLPKINGAYAAGGRGYKGCTYSSEVVNNFIGININYYVHLNISSIKKITDMLGGVDFDVPCKLAYEDPSQGLHIRLEKGRQHLDGDKAEQLLRFRKPTMSKYTEKEYEQLKRYYDGSDINRTETQVKFIKELINQKLNIQYMSSFNSVLNYAFKNIITNMNLSDALKLTTGLFNISKDDLTSFRLDGESKFISGGWYYIYNENFINVETKESLPSQEIVTKYFYSSPGIVAPLGDLSTPSEDSEDNSDAETTLKSSKSKTKKSSARNRKN